MLFALSGTVATLAADAGITNRVQVTAEYISALSGQMRTNHPALRAANARAAAAQASIGTVRTWEDPTAMIGGMAAEREMRAEDGDVIYGVEQKLPLFGKPRLARRAAEAEYDIEVANAEYQFQLLRAELAKALFRAAFADRVVAIGEQDLAWLDVMAQTAEAKYRAGTATLPELVQIMNERSKRATELQTSRDELEHEHVALNRLLNREPLSPWPRLELPPLANPVAYNERLLQLALRFEPRLTVLEHQIRQSEAARDVARRQRLPDVSIGLEGRSYSSDASFRQGMLTLSMNLPWGNARKYRNELRREEARLEAVRHELDDYRVALREEVHLLVVRIDAGRRNALLYRDEILPRTESALESVRAGWEAGRNTVRDLLDARRMVLEAQLGLARSISEQYQAMSELVLCCGLGDLGALEMINAQPESEPSPDSGH